MDEFWCWNSPCWWSYECFCFSSTAIAHDQVPHFDNHWQYSSQERPTKILTTLPWLPMHIDANVPSSPGWWGCVCCNSLCLTLTAIACSFQTTWSLNEYWMHAENRVCPSIHEVREGPATRVWLPLVSSQKKKRKPKGIYSSKFSNTTLLIHSQNRLSMQCTRAGTIDQYIDISQYWQSQYNINASHYSIDILKYCDISQYIKLF